VLRVSHSAVVDAWRQRDRSLIELGVGMRLVTSQQWDEGGAIVPFSPSGDEFASSARTVGTHPNAFVYDPRTLWRLLGSGDYDLLDLHEEPFSLAAAELMVLRALRAPRLPFVVYSAQNLRKRYPVPFRWIERWVLRRAAGAYPCNEAAGQIMRDKGLVGDLLVLPLGVDLDKFTPTERTAPTGLLRIAYVGRLDSHKGVDVLLRALTSDPRLDLTIAGEGPESQALRELATTLGLEGRCRFVGYLAQEDLADFYRSVDVVAVPSVPRKGWDEQFCRVAVESMACGVPVVASRTGALPEVVGQGGVLVPPRDAPALGVALASLLDQPALWQQLREAGLREAPRFSWDAVAAEQRGLYLRAVEGAHE
jgi:glycosyltransferase involved in cell wall biosynthesis